MLNERKRKLFQEKRIKMINGVCKFTKLNFPKHSVKPFSRTGDRHQFWHRHISSWTAGPLCLFIIIIILPNVYRSGWNLSEVCCCMEYTYGFNMTQIGAQAAPGQTETTSFFCKPKMYNSSYIQRISWLSVTRCETHKCLGSRLYCRETFWKFLTWRSQSRKRQNFRNPVHSLQENFFLQTHGTDGKRILRGVPFEVSTH